MTTTTNNECAVQFAGFKSAPNAAWVKSVVKRGGKEQGEDKMSKTEQKIAKIAARALAIKAGEYDWPMADAFTLAYTLRGETKKRALSALRALRDARSIERMWQEFQARDDGAQCAAYTLGLVPRTWLRPSVVERLDAQNQS